jgi:hypothetical protein
MLLRTLLLAALAVAGTSVKAADPGPDAIESFERDVRPLLVEHCLKCHGAEPKLKGGLSLNSRALALKGGDNGPALIPGKPEASLVVKALRYEDDDLKMPPKGKLSDVAIAKVVRWIEAGAPWPDAAVKPGAVAGGKMVVTDEQRRWWAFQPVKTVQPPPVNDRNWPRGDLDRFVLAKQEAKGMKPAASADKRTLIRRATFDLTGLPPGPEEIDDFLKDQGADAFARVVDRLLASPAYGERWGRHWLDVVRYADNRDARGLNGAEDIGEAWRYRDWVIRAFNRDLPYNRFIQDQIAGDVLQPEGGFDADRLIATGLLTIGEWGTGDADKEKMLTDIVDDQINAVGKAFLGLTLACARCHDHKFDPIPQADYYGLAGIFFSTHILPGPGPKTNGSPMLRTPLVSPQELARREQQQKRVKELEESVKRETAAAYSARAGAMLPQTAKYLLAVHEFQHRPADAVNESAAAFAARKRLEVGPFGRWIEFLGGSRYRLLPTLVRDVGGIKGILSWRGVADCPNALINSTRQEQTLLTFRLPPRSVAIHPGPTSGVAVAWQSPVQAKVNIAGRLADLDPNGGDGIAWRVDSRASDGTTHQLAAGDMPNGGTAMLDATSGRLTGVDVNPGDRIEVVVLPKANHTCDTTQVELTIAPASGGPSWDLARDLLDEPAQGNPHRDGHGHTGVWHLLDMAGGRILPENISAALAAWQRAEKQTADPSALVKAAAEFQKALAASDSASPFRIENQDQEGELLADARDRLKRLRAERDASVAKKLLAVEVALAAQEGGVPNTIYNGFHNARIHVRGLYTRLGDEVPRHLPVVLAGDTQPAITSGSGRAELARWIARPEHPLTARVMVNRIWQYHFGEGLVRTPNNFGKLGEPPTNPDLLDWLASRLVQEKWSIKAMHRLIMLSATYRQSSIASPDSVRLDPDNRLFGRAMPRRLEAEELRDALLAVSSRLDRAPGGPAFPEVATPRRSVYLRTVRSDRNGFRFLFDAPDPENSVDKRTVSTVAPQALFLLNHPFAIEQAKALASRLRKEAADDAARIARAYVLLYGRLPTDDEVRIGRDFLVRRSASGPAALDEYAHLLLCANEFAFVD